MLSAIQASLIDAIEMSDVMSDGMRDGKPDKATLQWNKIRSYLATHGSVIDADARSIGGDSKSFLSKFFWENKLCSEKKFIECMSYEGSNLNQC